MFYCPHCNNTYDIARTSKQTGGNFEFSSSSEGLEGGSYAGLIDKILKGTHITENDVKTVDIKKLAKSAEYKKLKQDEKEMVYNKIQDSLPEKLKKLIQNKPVETSDDNLAYFVCSNCSYSVKIEEGTRIFSRTSDDVSQTYGTGDYSDMLHSNIVPRTRKYVCPNKKCVSHKDPIKREAIFFRKNNSYEIVYICSACKTSF